MIRFVPGLVAAVALLAGCHRLAIPARDPAWSLADPRGDDHGDGELLLPVRGPAPGELDLVALRAHRVEGGTEFEAELGRPVQRPDGRVISATGETLAAAAALGFWTFNLDLYVDVDRIAGSGRTDTLPGRLAQVDPATAWERVICLTPRPVEAQARLRGLWAEETRRALTDAKASIGRAEDQALERQAAEAVERQAFFPRRVTVSGTSVRFFVPEAALPGGADPAFAYLAVVTAAALEVKVDLGAFFGKPWLEGLFNLPIAPGVQLEKLGGGRLNDPGQPPIVDALLDGAQEAALRARPAVLRGVVPAAASGR